VYFRKLLSSVSVDIILNRRSHGYTLVISSFLVLYGFYLV
jgi:hypothetical protein